MEISLTFILYYVSFVIPSLGNHIFDCPSGWETFINQCYKYVIYPRRNFHDSNLACQIDGATLVMIDDIAENEFIKRWIKKYSRSLQWYTDGTVNSNTSSPFLWQSSGKQISENDFWIDETEMKRKGSCIVYRQKGNTAGWSRSLDTAHLAYICEISREEAYRIVKKTRDYDYGKLMKDRNEILKGPNITIDAMDTVILESWPSVFLECVAEANPKPVYKWHHLHGDRWVEVTSTIDSRFTLTNGKLTIHKHVGIYDAGHYQCSAENEFGKVLGKVVQLSFAYLGDFSNVIPEPVHVDAYDPAIVLCSHISYKPAITYQWVKDDMNFVRTTKQRYMFISRNGRLYFSEVSLADVGEYRCLATLIIKHERNDDNIPSQLPSRISNAIRLIVRSKPSKVNWGPVIHNDFIAVFPSQPTIGEDVQLECFAQGSSDEAHEMIYRWSRVDAKFSDRVSFSDLNRVLHIKEATWDDEGQYKCTVQRGIKGRDKKVYFLRFQSKPIMVVRLKPQFVDIDSKVVWRCEASSQPKSSYTWYKNGVVLRSSEDVIISANTLIIDNARKGHHDGMYQCAASNIYGVTFSTAQLSVLAFKPNFLRSKTLRNTKGAIGGNVTLLCEAEAAPLPNITWKRNNEIFMNDLTPSRTQQLPNGNLFIQKLNINDQGSYSCMASNKFGQANLTFHLKVTEALFITAKPQDTEVLVNETATLRCDVSYNPNIDTVHQWHFNGISIQFVDNPHVRLSKEDPVGGLVIRNANFEYSGYYTCIAKSPINKIEAGAFLQVKGPPGEAAGLATYTTSIGRSSVQLKWVPPPNNGFPISHYIIYSRSTDQPDWKIQAKYIPIKSILQNDAGFHTTSISGLYSDQNYQFRIRAANIQGLGEISQPSGYIRTLISPPLIAPTTVTGGGGKVKTLVIQWTPLEIWEHGGPGIGYNVYWKLKTNGSDSWSNKTLKESVSSFTTYIGDQFYTEYEVKIQPFNDYGLGPNSTIHTIFSAEDIPLGVPNNVFATAYNGTAMVVTWDTVIDTRAVMRGRVLGYQVNYWDRDDPVRNSVSYYTTKGTVLVIGLRPNFYYWVTVQVFNTAGLGPVSEDYLGSTGSEAPLEYPTEIHVHTHGPDSVLVTFRGVSMTMAEDPVSGYKMCCWSVQEKFDLEKCVEFSVVSQGILTGLEKHFLYQLRVMAFSPAGDGKRSEVTYFTLGGQISFDQSHFGVIAAGCYSSAIKTHILTLIMINYILQL